MTLDEIGYPGASAGRDITTPADAQTVVFSCVLDDSLPIWRSFIPWLATLTGLAQVPSSAIVVHHVCPLREDIAAVLARMGVRTEPAEIFDRAYPHTNKIAQCQTDYGRASHVVLTDVDLAFVRPLPLGQVRAPVAGKAVDVANPALDVLCGLFEAAGLALPTTTVACSGQRNGRAEERELTLPGNFNGGLYVIERDVLPRLGEAWARWARWMIAQQHLPGPVLHHSDQISFCLALHALALDFQTLPDTWNYPTHLRMHGAQEPPLMLHHHARLDNALNLLPAIMPLACDSLERVNAAISDFRAETGA